MTVLNKPDIVETMMSELELKRVGSQYKALCPFHTEKTASFIVNPARQTFHCFGCNEHGDVITFIQKYKSISFKETLRYLNIDNSKPYKPNPREDRKKELLQQYRQWKNDYMDFLCKILRSLEQAKLKATTMRRVESLACHYHQEPIWEHHFNILYNGKEQEKFVLYRELKHGRRL
jgi:DNA primase catalytic core